MTNEQRAMAEAWLEYSNADCPSGGVKAACRAYYKHMIAVTHGLCVHEADGTVRRPTGEDL